MQFKLYFLSRSFNPLGLFSPTLPLAERKRKGARQVDPAAPLFSFWSGRSALFQHPVAQQFGDLDGVEGGSLEASIYSTIRTGGRLDLTLTDPDGNTFQIEIPKLKYTSGQPDVSGEGSVTVSMDFQAIYDSVDASNIVITRNPI